MILIMIEIKKVIMINCEVSLTLSWSATCVITSMEKIILVAGQLNRGGSPTNARFIITDCKFCSCCLICIKMET